jgi:hypothetical protein
MNIIFLIHVVLFCMALIIPFTNVEKWLVMYSLIIPFLFLHWATNDDTCALTELEVAITGKPKEQTFFNRLVGPILKLDPKTSNDAPKYILFGLWMLVQFKLDRVPASKIISKIYK